MRNKRTADKAGRRKALHPPWVAYQVYQIRYPQLLVEFPQQQKARIDRNLATTKIQNDFPLKAEATLRMTLRSHCSLFSFLAQLAGHDGFLFDLRMNIAAQAAGTGGKGEKA